MYTSKKNFYSQFFIFFSYFGTFFAFFFSVFTPIVRAGCDIDLSKNYSEAQLRSHLDECNQEIASQTKTLNEQRGRSKSIKKDVDFLNNTVTQTRKKIELKSLLISALNRQISQKKEHINDLSDRLDREKKNISGLLKKTNEYGNTHGVAHLLLGTKTVSGFYDNLNRYSILKEDLVSSSEKVRSIKNQTEKEAAFLTDKQVDELDARKAIEEEKKRVEIVEKEKRELLKVSQLKEKEQEKELKDREAKRGKILAAAFELAGGGKNIDFGDALKYAKLAGDATGVRPAFIMSIITQESNLGKNVGTCNRKGDPESKSYKNMMHPTRDIAPFLRITSALGRDPAVTPVSCRIGGVGYGGAMGPAQFIPSTWESVAPKAAAKLGIASADPWKPRDAFMASAVYLAQIGATGKTYSTERNAACRYYSGRACDDRKPANSFYGNQVADRATRIQGQIDYLDSTAR